MPVDVDGVADFVGFANNAIYDGQALKSIFLRTISDGDGSANANRILSKTGAADTDGWGFGRQDSTHPTRANRFVFIQTATVNPGLWDSDSGTFNASTEYSLGVSLDVGNINNTPLLYIDGSSVNVNEGSDPAGAFHTTDTEGLQVGKLGGSGDAGFYNGKVWDIHIANVIWTPAEFASLHASNAPGLWMRGLIFYAPMNGAAGLQTFGGAALGGANTVIDIINGIIGTAASSPLGVADTTLAV